MGVRRFVARGLAGALALGVGALLLIPVAAILAAVVVPVLIFVAAVGGVASLVMALAGVPAIIAVILALIAVTAIVVLLGGLLSVGVMALKALLFGLLLFWLARTLFGWSGPRRHRTVLVGHPINEVPPPGPMRDKYDIAAERELDRELGF